MWINCDTDSNGDVKYYADNEFFCVKSNLKDSNFEPKLFAVFFDNSKFLLGKYMAADGNCTLDKKYSLSYLSSQGIDYKKLSHFVIDYGNQNKKTAYPNTKYDINSDPAVIRAKKTLSMVKSKTTCNNGINDFINNIKQKAKHYSQKQLPFMYEYTWYTINNNTEDFDLSAIRHLILSENFNLANNEWYFGMSTDDRVYAIGVKAQGTNINPLSNADDCTCMYVSENSADVFFVAGLLLLDDGQYFCRLN